MSVNLPNLAADAFRLSLEMSSNSSPDTNKASASQKQQHQNLVTQYKQVTAQNPTAPFSVFTRAILTNTGPNQSNPSTTTKKIQGPDMQNFPNAIAHLKNLALSQDSQQEAKEYSAVLRARLIFLGQDDNGQPNNLSRSEDYRVLLLKLNVIDKFLVPQKLQTLTAGNFLEAIRYLEKLDPLSDDRIEANAYLAFLRTNLTRLGKENGFANTHDYKQLSARLDKIELTLNPEKRARSQIDTLNKSLNPLIPVQVQRMGKVVAIGLSLYAGYYYVAPFVASILSSSQSPEQPTFDVYTNGTHCPNPSFSFIPAPLPSTSSINSTLCSLNHCYLVAKENVVVIANDLLRDSQVIGTMSRTLQRSIDIISTIINE